MDKERARRAQRRRTWVGELRTQQSPAQLSSAEDRLLSMWVLAEDAAAHLGRVDRYTRDMIPGRLIRKAPSESTVEVRDSDDHEVADE